MNKKITAKELNTLAENGSEVELIKHNSDYLRGNIKQDLSDKASGSISADSTQLIKFHGMYQQDDRDIRLQRTQARLEPDYSFMIRLRLPGGELNAEQVRALCAIARQTEAASLKLTTRQAIQLHGVLKHNLKATVQAYHAKLLDSIAACGDVNRNVMCSPNPTISPNHAEVFAYAARISEYLLPQSRAWHEVWLDEKPSESDEGQSENNEELYGKHYLPRKFKIAIAIPPFNDVDIYANDIGLIAIFEAPMLGEFDFGERQLVGFNVLVGGGLGATHGREDTYARIGEVIGFCPADQVCELCAAIMKVQRDYGNRQDRALARLKYTIDRLGLAEFKGLVESYWGQSLKRERGFSFKHNYDPQGWRQDKDSLFYLNLRTVHGRLRDEAGSPRWLAFMEQLAQQNICSFRVTPNQNLLLGGIKAQNKTLVIQAIQRHGITEITREISGMRRNSMACTAFNTCSLAMAEAERYLPQLVTKIEEQLAKYDLLKEKISIRMTGCPNGCGRSRLGEIGLVGKSLGRYQLYLGGSVVGNRLNNLYHDNLDEAGILNSLDPLFMRFSQERAGAESFGDFVLRNKIV